MNEKKPKLNISNWFNNTLTVVQPLHDGKERCCMVSFEKVNKNTSHNKILKKIKETEEFRKDISCSYDKNSNTIICGSCSKKDVFKFD